VTEAKQQAAKRKSKPWNKHRPEGPWDYLVIGSGMGGLCAAAFLSKLGKRVLVLEQHTVPGGFTHTFKRKGYSWDVGVHAVGEVTLHSTTGRLLSRLTDGRLEWSSLGSHYEEFHYPDDFRIEFPNSPMALEANLKEAFPKEGEAIEAYVRAARDVAKSMKAYYLARCVPPRLAGLADRALARKAKGFLVKRTDEAIAELTEDPKLRAVFAAQWAYYGSPPSRSSWAMQALVVKHFLWGGFYPVGGSGAIARELCKTIADAGGWTTIRADVQEIILEDDRAVGVRLDGGDEVRAPKIISAAGVMSTVNRLLPEVHRCKPWAQSVSRLDPAPAHVCLYLGFKGDIREAGCSGANKWFYNTWNVEDETWEVSENETPGQAPVLYCSFPSLKDPTHDPGPETRHTGEVVTFVPWDAFAKWRGSRWMRRGDDYEAFKKRLEESLLEQFLERIPKLRPMLDYVELSTPLSTDHFVRPQAGSIYGIEPTVERFMNPWLRPRSPIEGLFFAGSEVSTVGVLGAMMGGVLCAASAEPLAAIRYLRRT
jgi:all-trans-retinol 13,14-reductase